jgi:uncharacterized protein YcbK (DUF882 family)
MNTKQKQALLFYLGYYDGSIDGVFGSGSEEATKAFQRDFGLKVDGICGSETEKALKHAVCYGISKKQDAPVVVDFWSDIKYFKQSEFRCKCGCGADTMQEKLIRVADRTREHFGKPMQVSSGRRCANHNARVGGVSNSRHLSGKAMDFCVVGKTAAQVLDYVKSQPEIRYAYAIDGSYVHMDVN